VARRDWSRARQVRVGVGVAVLAVVAFALVFRSDGHLPAGPLGGRPASSSVTSIGGLHVGDEFTWGLVLEMPKGSTAEAVLDAVTVPVPDGLEMRSAETQPIGGPSIGLILGDQTSGFDPVQGSTVTADARLRVYVVIRATTPGHFHSAPVRIQYHIGSTDYEAIEPWTVEATVDAQP
jgi:hypothetical protein